MHQTIFFILPLKIRNQPPICPNIGEKLSKFLFFFLGGVTPIVVVEVEKTTQSIKSVHGY
jgi:hypothetical protein